MTERQSHETAAIANKFGRQIAEKGLPVGERGATKFAEFLLGFKPPEGLLDKLAASCGYIDQATLDRYLSSMAYTVNGIAEEKPHYVVLRDTGKSAQWVYEELLKKGINDPYDTFAYLDLKTDLTVKLAENMHHSIPFNSAVIVLDDWSISGRQIIEPLIFLHGGYESTVLLLATTSRARKEMEQVRPGIKIIAAKPDDISLLDDILTPSDHDFFRRLYESTTPEEERDKRLIGSGLNGDNILFSSVHKTPDNVPTIFTGGRSIGGVNIPPLILPITPPYASTSYGQLFT